jgi:hypothetical protein
MLENLEFILQVATFLGLLAVGYTAGVTIEKRHFRSIIERERALLHLPAVGMKRVDFGGDVASTELVTGSVVVSVDYFKRFLAGLRNFWRKATA